MKLTLSFFFYICDIRIVDVGWLISWVVIISLWIYIYIRDGDDDSFMYEEAMFYVVLCFFPSFFVNTIYMLFLRSQRRVSFLKLILLFQDKLTLQSDKKLKIKLDKIL